MSSPPPACRTGHASAPWSAGFRTATPMRALRQKEWMLLRRDPWLMSQTLMQILYLLPPGLLLWRSFEGGGALLVLVPVLVDGCWAVGGRARLARDFGRGRAGSGGDCAGIRHGRSCARRSRRSWAGIAIVFLPFIAALALLSPFHALVAAPASSGSAARQPKSSSGFALRPSAAISAAGRFPRAWRHSRRLIVDHLGGHGRARRCRHLAGRGHRRVIAIAVLLGARVVAPR